MSQSRARRGVPRALDDREALWTYLAFEWAAGATLLTLVLQTTQASQANRPALYGVCVVAYVCVVAMLAGRTRLPVALVEPTVLAGHVLISVVVYFSGDATSFFAMYYVWLNVYVFSFFGLRSGWAHSAMALACYAVALSALPGAGAWTPWLMTAGTMVVVGSMVGLLRGRVDRLVAELAETARRDPLTGLVNRRGFGEAIATEIERSRRSERPFSLIVADIDHFKLVNDRAGHAAGDEVLGRVGALLNAGTRQIDSAARLGGEEFAVLVPDTDADGAHALAERLRQQVRERFADDLQPITMSFGIAMFPCDGGNAVDMLAAADKAMYTAKRLGRDRCERFGATYAAHGR